MVLLDTLDMETFDLSKSSGNKPKKKLYLLLDRSALTTQSRFEKLKNALTGVVPSVAEVLVTPRLLSETLALWHLNQRSTEAREHLQFILRIGNPRWFDEPVEIAKLELCAHTLPDKYYFLSSADQRIWKQNIHGVIAGGTARPEVMERVNVGVQKEKERATKLRKIGVRIRDDVSHQFKATSQGKKLSEVDVKGAWDSIQQAHLDRFGEGLIIRKHIYQAGRRSLALNRWANERGRCPYFTSWAKGLLYLQFYAARYPNLKIDEHGQADIEHLIYLEHADVLVSEEKTFLRQAFLDLYERQGKRYWTLDELWQWASESIDVPAGARLSGVGDADEQQFRLLEGGT